MKLIILPQAFRAMVPLLLTRGIVLYFRTPLLVLCTQHGGLLPHPRRLSAKRDGTQVETNSVRRAVYFVISLGASLLVSYLDV